MASIMQQLAMQRAREGPLAAAPGAPTETGMAATGGAVARAGQAERERLQASAVGAGRTVHQQRTAAGGTVAAEAGNELEASVAVGGSRPGQAGTVAAAARPAASGSAQGGGGGGGAASAAAANAAAAVSGIFGAVSAAAAAAFRAGSGGGGTAVAATDAPPGGAGRAATAATRDTAAAAAAAATAETFRPCYELSIYYVGTSPLPAPSVTQSPAAVPSAPPAPAASDASHTGAATAAAAPPAAAAAPAPLPVRMGRLSSSLHMRHFGALLHARQVLAAHCMTSVQFSPSGDHVLLAYGRRHISLCGLVACGGQLAAVHSVVEVYRCEWGSGCCRGVQVYADVRHAVAGGPAGGSA